MARSIIFVICVLAKTLLASAATIIDLSTDLEIDEDAINSSPGSLAVNQIARSDNRIRTAMVLEGGKIVASYTRKRIGSRVDENQVVNINSVTKSWISLMIGMLIDEGKLSLETTLGDIFQDSVWRGIDDADLRKAITIREMLTMTSGLQTPKLFRNYSSLSGTLAHPPLGEKGVFSYLAFGDIMSYIILKVSGLSPRKFLSRHILPSLCIKNRDISWRRNKDGVEWGSGGLMLTTKQMAKFGQLYLQGGKTQILESSRIVSEEWIDESWTVASENLLDNELNGSGLNMGYGFLWFSIGDTDVRCALGLGGQDICVSPSLDRVIVQQRDSNLFYQNDGNLVVAEIAIDGNLSFNAKKN